MLEFIIFIFQLFWGQSPLKRINICVSGASYLCGMGFITGPGIHQLPIGPLFINMLLIWAARRALSKCLMSRPPLHTNVELFHMYFLCNMVMYMVIKSWEIEQFRVVDFLSQTRHQWRGFTTQTTTSSLNIFVRSFFCRIAYRGAARKPTSFIYVIAVWKHYPIIYSLLNFTVIPYAYWIKEIKFKIKTPYTIIVV